MTTAPSHVPTENHERIAALDVIRGVAVLGILLMNIVAFGLPYAYDNPNVWGGAQGWNRVVWEVNALFFEGTMRGLFTLLFGAGALLFLSRHIARDSGLRPAELYFRRTLWLIVFGLVNGYLLLWQGDILFFYGAVGLFLFVFRNVSPTRLIVIAALALTIPTLVTVIDRTGFRNAEAAADLATDLRSQGLELTAEQRRAIDRFAEMNQDREPPRRELREQIREMRGSYLDVFRVVSDETEYLETTLFFRVGFAECFGMMLLGMALFKLGILTGRAPTHTYALLMFIGYTIGLGINIHEVDLMERGGFGLEAMQDAALTYDLGRIPMTLGHVGLLCLLARARPFATCKRVLAAAGQMALTNYLAQSIICAFVFTGIGFGLYGQLQRYELYYVVGFIWLAELIWSSWWLKRFRFGPAEWLWRSLTYGELQPMRRTSERAPRETQEREISQAEMRQPPVAEPRSETDGIVTDAHAP
jgi:uncharacterized protein